METGHDRYGRTLAVCFVVDEDLNAWMVSQGLALAFVRYSTKYYPQQDAAREQRQGMWSGAFIAPWDWRYRNRQTEILGAVLVPIDSQDKLLPPAASGRVFRGTSHEP
jgi:endonuclease YncB( thermonuclease family)